MRASGAATSAVFLLSACAGGQSSLDPKASAAALIAQSHWIMVAGSVAILVLVMALALYAAFRDPQRRWQIAPNAIILGGGVVMPVIVLTALLLYAVMLMGQLRAGQAGGGDDLQIEVIANQWWWEVRYPGKVASDADFVTANELYLPVGRPVSVRLTSRDVIHSFWIPSLAGKMDVVPGKERRLRLQADVAGTFRGQCAEFCGAQHARMALLVVAEPPEAFEARLARIREPAARPASELAARGRVAFFLHTCADCHGVRGYAEQGAIGPDLTRLRDRAWIGAEALANTPENVVAWIALSQRIKPGNRMPSYEHLDASTLEALAAFLLGESE